MNSGNYFGHRSAAKRYQGGRPFFHPQVIRRIKDRLKLTEPLERALDVGCGTGLSARALTEIVRRIIGIDVSASMIACAPADPRIRYCIASAEELPIQNAVVDLVTACSAWHWMDRKRLFAESRRVLQPGGRLVAYENLFTGQTMENPEFQAWFQSSFLINYPTPPRNRVEINEADASREGFMFFHEEPYQNEVELSVRNLVDYLMTLSNIIAAVEGGGRAAEEVARWLTENVRPFYGRRSESTFLFSGTIWYFQKTE